MPSFRSLFVAALASASTAAAAAITTPRAVRVQVAPANLDNSYHWTLTDWDAWCADGCQYSFNVSGPYSAGSMPIPAFEAACSGAGVGAPYQFCTVLDSGAAGLRRQVAARLMDPTGVDGVAGAANATGARLAVTYQFDDLNSEGTWWNYTSYSTQPYSEQGRVELDITEIYGVA